MAGRSIAVTEMEYELDIDAAHLVEWLRREMEPGGKQLFEINASRSFTSQDAGGETAPVVETDEIASMSSVGVLEVKPAADSGGHWLLRVRVEDIVGAHLPEEGSVPDEPEDLTLDGFEADFLTSDQGTVYVTVELETGQDREKFDSFLNDLQTDRHEF